MIHPYSQYLSPHMDILETLNPIISPYNGLLAALYLCLKPQKELDNIQHVIFNFYCIYCKFSSPINIKFCFNWVFTNKLINKF